MNGPAAFWIGLFAWFCVITWCEHDMQKQKITLPPLSKTVVECNLR